jgi:hypothetical protein
MKRKAPSSPLHASQFRFEKQKRDRDRERKRQNFNFEVDYSKDTDEKLFETLVGCLANQPISPILLRNLLPESETPILQKMILVPLIQDYLFQDAHLMEKFISRWEEMERKEETGRVPYFARMCHTDQLAKDAILRRECLDLITKESDKKKYKNKYKALLALLAVMPVKSEMSRLYRTSLLEKIVRYLDFERQEEFFQNRVLDKYMKPCFEIQKERKRRQNE